MKILFNAIQYNDHLWNTYGELKVIAIVMGMQRGCMKRIAETILKNPWKNSIQEVSLVDVIKLFTLHIYVLM